MVRGSEFNRLLKLREIQQKLIDDLVNKIETECRKSDEEISLDFLTLDLKNLKSKEEQYRRYTDDISSKIPVDQLEEEIFESNRYLDNLNRIEFLADRRVSSLVGGSRSTYEDSCSVVSSEKSRSVLFDTGPDEESRVPSSLDRRFKKKSSIKKPSIELKKFSGKNRLEWIEFWDAFSSSIHEDEDLADVDKLVYLKNLLEDDARDTIRGIRITNSNYKIALDLLTEKYGREDVIVNEHVSELLRLEPVKADNLLKLRRLYETLEFHIRALENLNRPAESYVTVLFPFILTRLPADINLLWARSHPAAEFPSLNILLGFLKKEIEAREKSSFARNVFYENKEEKKSSEEGRKSKMPATASALATNTKTKRNSTGSWPESCGFCKSDKCKPESCDEAKKLIIEQRSSTLRQNGGCYTSDRKSVV